jgi:hypothetical protein
MTDILNKTVVLVLNRNWSKDENARKGNRLAARGRPQAAHRSARTEGTAGASPSGNGSLMSEPRTE